jgi:hypothetical protein
MLAIRVFTFAIAALVAIPAAAQVIPYQGVGTLGTNNVYDIDLTMCQLNPAPPTLPSADPAGCIDRFFDRCTADPQGLDFCQVRAVPAGRCAGGTTCQWNEGVGSHRCTTNTDITCVTDAHCPPGDTCNPALGDTPTAVANCACNPDGSDEQSVCGGGLAAQARCSDGDPGLPVGDLHASGLCTWTVLGDPGATPTNCGLEAGQALTGPRGGGWENAPSAITPQRQPGTGLSAIGQINNLKGTVAIDLQDPDPNGFGIRRYTGVGKSIYVDWGFAAKEVSGAAVSAILPAYPIDLPTGWRTEDLIGTCDGLGTEPAGTLCLVNFQCGSGGTCTGLSGPYTHAVDEVGFIFTQDIPEDTGGEDRCPPKCGLDYHMHTLEQEELEAVTREQVESGVQLALDFATNFGSPQVRGVAGRAGAGDAISALATFVPVWLTDDVRCFMAGDPGRADPNDSKIGICTGASAGAPPSCDPATEDGATNDCEASFQCVYCGGRFDAVTNPLALPEGYDDQAGNCKAGFDCSVLALEGRMSGRNNRTFNLKVPLSVIYTTGYVQAELVDTTCPGTPAGNCLTAGNGTVSGAPGIGPGPPWDKYDPNEVLPAFKTRYGGNGETSSGVSWAAEMKTGTGLKTGDFKPGPDGIPGCIGDNQKGIDGPPCAGVGSPPGTTVGAGDDLPRLTVTLPGETGPGNAAAPPRVGDPGTGLTAIPNPLAGISTGTGLKGELDDPNGAPTIRMVAAGSARDLNVLGTQNNDSLFKISRVICPVRSDGPDCWFDNAMTGSMTTSTATPTTRQSAATRVTRTAIPFRMAATTARPLPTRRRPTRTATCWEMPVTTASS